MGGLGFGATLRGVLAVVAEGTRVVVVEKLEAVIAIGRTHAARLGTKSHARCTRYARADVVDVIARERNAAALRLDVDNDAGWASFRQNARLYSESGLERARAAPAPGRIFAVWSGYEEKAFIAALRVRLAPKSMPLRERGVVAARPTSPRAESVCGSRA